MEWRLFQLVCVSGLLMGCATTQNSDVSIGGRVTLEGKLPRERPLSLDPRCAEAWRKSYGEVPPTTKFFSVGEDRGLADVVVWLEPVEGEFPVPTEAHRLVIRGCFFERYVSAARAGQTIEVVAADEKLFNIHPTPRVPGNPEYNRAMLPGGLPVRFRFPKPEMFLRMKGDVHPWLYAYISLFDHPYFAVTDEAGRYQLPAPPQGNYRLRFRHRKLPEGLTDIRVRQGRSVSVDVGMNYSAGSRQPPKIVVR